MKKLALLLLLLATASLHADYSVTLAWDPPPSTEVPLTGYRVYYSANNGPVTAVEVAGPVYTKQMTGLLAATTYAFSVSAISTEGLESAPSATVTWSAPSPTPAIREILG